MAYFGNQTVESANGYGAANALYGGLFVGPGSDGEVINAFIYNNSFVSGNAKAVILHGSTYAVLGVSSPVAYTTSPGWITYPFPTPAQFPASINIWICVIGDNWTGIKGLGTLSSQVWRRFVDNGNSYSSPAAPSSPTLYNTKLSMYAEWQSVTPPPVPTEIDNIAAFVDSGLVAEGRGKIGAYAFSRNRGGQYYRAIGNPPAPSDAGALAQQSALSSVVAAWQDLTETERGQWNRFARSATKSKPVRGARSYSGYHFFVKLHLARWPVSTSILSTPPGFGSTTPILPTSLTAVSGGSPSLVLGVDQSSFDSGHHALVYATDNLPSEVTHWKNKLKLIGSYSSAPSDEIDIYSDWVAAFGGPLVAADHVTVVVVTLNLPYGWRSPRVPIDAVIS